MIFAPSRARFCGLLLLLGLVAACGPDSEPPEAAPAASEAASGFTHERPPSSGGLEVIVQDDENPERPGYFDFGSVALGEIVHHTFVLRNADPRRVVLQKVDPGCGCTVARLGKRLPDGSLEPALSDRPGELMHIEPGEVIEVSLRVDTSAIRDKNTDKHFMVRLASDSVTRPFLTLECHLFVRQRFQVAPKSLNLGAIPIGAGKEAQTTIKALGAEPSRLTGLGPLPAGVEARLERSPLSGPDNEIWTLVAGYVPPLDKGRLSTTLVVHTEGPDGKPGMDLEINMAGTGVDDVTITPSRLILRPHPRSASGKDPAADPARIEAELISHLAGHRFRVTGYKITGEAADSLRLEATAYRPSADGASAEWTLALVATSPPSVASFTGMIVIELDDPQYPRLELPYAGLGF